MIITGVTNQFKGGDTETLEMEFVDSSGNVIDAIKSGLTFRVSCTTRGSAQVSDEIARGGMKDLNYDHGNGVTYYFRVPTNADSNLINSINIIFPNEYDLSNDIRFVGTDGVSETAPSVFITGQRIALKGLTPFEGFNTIGFQIEGVSNLLYQTNT